MIEKSPFSDATYTDIYKQEHSYILAHKVIKNT